jgi:hypothetical protein
MSDSPNAESTSAPNAESSKDMPITDTTLTILGEVLDLLAGIEARQKVLAREIATIRAVLHNQPSEEVLEDLHNSFTENLEDERNRILSRVSLLSNFPSQDASEES